MFIAHYILVSDMDQDAVNELIPQYFLAEFDPSVSIDVKLDTYQTLVAIKLAADEFRRTNRPVPAEALMLLTMAKERACTNPLLH
jgi:hypothetical protein